MAAQNSRFNRILLILMVVLYVISLAAFTYANWKVEPEHVLWSHAVNALILSIPLVLFYGSIYVLVSAWREHRLTGGISPRLAKVIHWAPRIAAILIIGFMSLFSLDVFETQAPPLELLGGFLIHNLPSIAMIVLLFFAWKRPAVGFVAFLIFGALFAIFFVRDFYALSNLLLFVLPILLIACLFYIDWKWLGAPPTSAVH